MNGEGETVNDVFETIRSLLEKVDEETLNSDFKLKKQIVEVLQFKFGFDEDMVKETVREFKAKANNYRKIYEACDEQMEKIDKLKLVK